jgi:hypothetical protein
MTLRRSRPGVWSRFRRRNSTAKERLACRKEEAMLRHKNRLKAAAKGTSDIRRYGTTTKVGMADLPDNVHDVILGWLATDAVRGGRYAFDYQWKFVQDFAAVRSTSSAMSQFAPQQLAPESILGILEQPLYSIPVFPPFGALGMILDIPDPPWQEAMSPSRESTPPYPTWEGSA